MLNLKMKFAHVLYKDINIGLAHLEYPKVIKWYETHMEDELNPGHGIQIIDSDADKMELAKVIIDLAFMEIKIGNNMIKEFPCIKFKDI